MIKYSDSNTECISLYPSLRTYKFVKYYSGASNSKYVLSQMKKDQCELKVAFPFMIFVKSPGYKVFLNNKPVTSKETLKQCIKNCIHVPMSHCRIGGDVCMNVFRSRNLKEFITNFTSTKFLIPYDPFHPEYLEYTKFKSFDGLVEYSQTLNHATEIDLSMFFTKELSTFIKRGGLRRY